MDYRSRVNSTSPARVVLIRHAESKPAANLPESEWPLSRTGKIQAEALVKTLRIQGIEAVYSSPYLRAIDTVKPFAEAVGLEVHIDTNLRERELTHGFHADWKELIHKAWDDLTFALPGCESGLDCQARIRGCVDGLALRNHGRTIAVASHGNAIGLFLNSLDGTFGLEGWASMNKPDVFCVEYDSGGTPTWDTAFNIDKCCATS